MGHHRLPDHLGLCDIEGRLLMLDLRRDRYFELDDRSAAGLRAWRAAEPQEGERPEVAGLVERGFLVPADRADLSGWVERDAPIRSLLDLDPRLPRSAWAALPETAAALWAVRRRLRRGLARAVDHARAIRPASNGGDANPPFARFRAARRLVPLPPNCLLDSLALLAILARRGIGCELVFGVKLDPFAAHCWLEANGVVLNDSTDTISSFKPILVV